jgi:hypothetical protein
VAKAHLADISRAVARQAHAFVSDLVGAAQGWVRVGPRERDAFLILLIGSEGKLDLATGAERTLCPLAVGHLPLRACKTESLIADLSRAADGSDREGGNASGVLDRHERVLDGPGRTQIARRPRC